MEVNPNVPSLELYFLISKHFEQFSIIIAITLFKNLLLYQSSLLDCQFSKDMNW